MQPPKAYLSQRMGKALQINLFSWHKSLPLPCLFSKSVTDVAKPGRGKRKTYSKITLPGQGEPAGQRCSLLYAPRMKEITLLLKAKHAQGALSKYSAI